MKLNKLIGALCALTVITACTARRTTVEEMVFEPQRIIFETDMGNDVDDALALDMIYKYQDAGLVDLLGVMTNKPGIPSAEYLDIMNTWYGYPEIPIGIVEGGADCENDAVNYANAVCVLQNADGAPVFARTLTDYQSLPSATSLYRQLLALQPDTSVTIISVGFSTNLAALLDSPADSYSDLTGRELVARKVKLLSVMAGCFDRPDFYEYNVVKDIPAAQKVFSQWPTPIVTSPFEVGIAITYPSSSIENDFGWTAQHPMVEAYKSYLPMPYDRPTWDLTSVLYAIEGPSYFTVSPAGNITVSDKGETSFVANPVGNHHYLMTDSVQGDVITKRFVDLITQKPANK